MHAQSCFIRDASRRARLTRKAFGTAFNVRNRVSGQMNHFGSLRTLENAISVHTQSNFFAAAPKRVRFPQIVPKRARFQERDSKVHFKFGITIWALRTTLGNMNARKLCFDAYDV
jgi:hypothetical protein